MGSLSRTTNPPCTPHAIHGLRARGVGRYFRAHFSGGSKAVEKRMAVVDRIGWSSSPDELLHELVEGDDGVVVAGQVLNDASRYAW